MVISRQLHQREDLPVLSHRYAQSQSFMEELYR